MKPLPVRQFHAAFQPAEWDGVNRSGIRVVGKTVLVLMDTATGQSTGQHGAPVIIPDDQLEGLNAGCISGVLVAVSEGAFCVNEDGSPWSGEKPKPGDRVNIAKYAGIQIPGRDDRIYRLMDYGCIGGVYVLDAEYEAFVLAEEARLGIVRPPPPPAPQTLFDASTAAGLIDYRCAELDIPQIDGPAYAYVETQNGKRHVYSSHRTSGVERIDAERALAASVKNAIEPNLVIVWRCRPEVTKEGDGWYAYCRFVQVDREEGKEISSAVVAARTVAESGEPRTGLTPMPGNHDWDPENMKCRACGTKLVDVENGASADCPALVADTPRQHGAAVAA